MKSNAKFIKYENVNKKLTIDSDIEQLIKQGARQGRYWTKMEVKDSLNITS